MNVTIELVTLVAKEIFVDFSTDVGSAVAVWHGAPPKVGDHYDVELEIGDEFFWGVNACPALNNVDSIKVRDDIVTMTGTLISNETNGCGVVDLRGSKILVELAGCAEVGPLFVDLKVKSLSLYPTGV